MDDVDGSIDPLYQGERKLPETGGLPVYIESSPKISDTIIIKCAHCGQEFSDQGLNIAIFLYGIFFLVGKEIGYFGITCPCCLNTIYERKSSNYIIGLKNILTGFIKIGEYEFDPNLRYFSSFFSSPDEIPEIGEFNISNNSCFISHDYPKRDYFFIKKYVKANPHLWNEYLCSFILDGTYPMGTQFSVWWFKNDQNTDQIDKLVKIENRKNIKIFPRYYHYCSLVDNVDSFCWKYDLLEKYPTDLKKRAVSNLEELIRKANYIGIDEKNFLENTPGTLTPDLHEFFFQNARINDPSDIFYTTGDFLNVLTTDPNPWDLHDGINLKIKEIWKTKLPFQDKKYFIHFDELDTSQFEIRSNNTDSTKIRELLYNNYREKYVQEFLFKNYKSFIDDYVNLNKSKTFAYADLWDLKEKYLHSLMESIQKEIKINSTNQFYREDGFWLLSFQGKRTRIKDFKGCSYLNYLLTNINRDCTYTELNNMLESQGEKTENEEDQIKANGLNITVGKSRFKEKMIPLKRVEWAMRVRPKIEEAIEEATLLGNAKKVDRLKAGISKMDDYFNKFLPKKGGKPKTYETVYAYKTNKDKIDKAIKEVLKFIKKYDENAWRHLKYSIKNRLGHIGYESSDDADWYTGQKPRPEIIAP